MKQRLIEFLSSRDSGKFHPINKLIIATKNPTTREHVQAIKKELIAHVADGTIEIEADRHLQLDAIDPNIYTDEGGLAQPRRYFDLTTVPIHARGKKDRVAGVEEGSPFHPLPKPEQQFVARAQRDEPQYVQDTGGARRAEFNGVITDKSEVDEPTGVSTIQPEAVEVQPEAVEVQPEAVEVQPEAEVAAEQTQEDKPDEDFE